MMTTLNECSYNRTMLNIGGTAPFQADANYGIPAAIIEAFIQSHEVVRWNDDDELVPASNTDEDKVTLIRLLPSVPENWLSRGGGSFKGVSARGGFTVSASWDNKGNLRTSSIRSELENEAIVTIGKTVVGSDKGAKLRVTGEKAARFIKISGKKGTVTEVKSE
jgi:alpha-L-fucosidase 2